MAYNVKKRRRQVRASDAGNGLELVRSSSRPRRHVKGMPSCGDVVHMEALLARWGYLYSLTHALESHTTIWNIEEAHDFLCKRLQWVPSHHTVGAGACKCPVLACAPWSSSWMQQ
eukprot:jgi/Ulvmu1/10668/UM066_0052.1